MIDDMTEITFKAICQQAADGLGLIMTDDLSEMMTKKNCGVSITNGEDEDRYQHETSKKTLELCKKFLENKGIKTRKIVEENSCVYRLDVDYNDNKNK